LKRAENGEKLFKKRISKIKKIKTLNNAGAGAVKASPGEQGIV
jgi:hypothetical protein